MHFCVSLLVSRSKKKKLNSNIGVSRRIYRMEIHCKVCDIYSRFSMMNTYVVAVVDRIGDITRLDRSTPSLFVFDMLISGADSSGGLWFQFNGG